MHNSIHIKHLHAPGAVLGAMGNKCGYFQPFF